MVLWRLSGVKLGFTASFVQLVSDIAMKEAFFCHHVEF
jgi:hypothetical protein